MATPSQEEIISIVSSIFEVRSVDTQLDLIEFRISDIDVKEKFVKLAQKLESLDTVCKLEKSGYEKFIIVRRMPQRKPNRFLNTPWTPRILFAVVIGFVMIDGYYKTQGANEIINIGDPITVASIYTLSLLGILGIHELGHLIAARMHHLKTTWPYFIPGLPIIGIPTFGAFIQSRGLTINREILFDVAIAGPIAGLVIAVLVALYGAYTAPILDEQLAQELFDQEKLRDFDQGEPLLLKASLAVFGKGGEGQEVILTPILWAAWLGFLITFLNLLPAWQLDGGHMARTIFGEKAHRYATFGSMGILILLGYWFMALFILFLSSRNPSAMPLDDISPLSKNRRKIYILVIVLAVLCAPLPSTILP